MDTVEDRRSTREKLRQGERQEGVRRRDDRASRVGGKNKVEEKKSKQETQSGYEVATT